MFIVMLLFYCYFTTYYEVNNYSLVTSLRDRLNDVQQTPQSLDERQCIL